MNLVSLNRVSKEYPRGAVAVDDLSFDLDNELLVLMGASGSGKSTTLRMIAGLERPTAGSISMSGQAIDALPPRRRQVAMVFQQGALYPHLTARDNMEFALRLRRVTNDEITRRVAQAAESLEITNLLDRRPRELSGGEQQRVALGRAIVQQPRLFLFDEPLSSLNAELRRPLRQLIRELQSRLGTPMIYVTHDPSEAMALGTRIAFLRAGRLEQIGAPRELYSNPVNRFVAEGLGGLGMNLLAGTILGDETSKLAVGDQTMAIDPLRLASPPQSGRNIVIGIRPEHVRIGESSRQCGGFHLVMNVQAVEYFGTTLRATLVAAGQTMVASLPIKESIAVNLQVTVTAADEDVFFFNAQTGERLRGQLVPTASDYRPAQGA